MKPLEEHDVANDPVIEEDDNRTNTQVAVSVVEPESIIEEIPTSTKIDGFGNDIGLWPDMPTHDMIAFWANKASSSLQYCDEQVFEEFQKKPIMVPPENTLNIFFSTKIRIMRP